MCQFFSILKTGQIYISIINFSAGNLKLLCDLCRHSSVDSRKSRGLLPQTSSGGCAAHFPNLLSHTNDLIKNSIPYLRLGVCSVFESPGNVSSPWSSHSKISNLTIIELLYSHTLNIKRGSLHSISFRRIHFSVFRYKWTKNGFTGPKRFRGLRETGLWPWLFERWIHWIIHYPADSVVCCVNTYPLDSDLSGGGQRFHPLNNPESDP